jgi:hypothetical protein
MIRALLDRSFKKFLGNNRKDVVSEFNGGTVICITTCRTEEPGSVYQILLMRDEIGLLPPEMRNMLHGDLTKPAVSGTFVIDLEKGTSGDLAPDGKK